MKVRPIDRTSRDELNAVVAFSMMATWEGTPEARRDPAAVPGFGFRNRHDLYENTLPSRDFEVLLAEEGEVVVGCSVGRLAVDSRQVRYGHSVDLYVLPDFRRRGIGRSLVAETERFFATKHAAYIWVEVHHANAGALHFFMNSGFSLSEPRYGRWWFYVALKRLEGTLPPSTESRTPR